MGEAALKPSPSLLYLVNNGRYDESMLSTRMVCPRRVARNGSGEHPTRVVLVRVGHVPPGPPRPPTSTEATESSHGHIYIYTNLLGYIEHILIHIYPCHVILSLRASVVRQGSKCKALVRALTPPVYSIVPLLHSYLTSTHTFTLYVSKSISLMPPRLFSDSQ